MADHSSRVLITGGLGYLGGRIACYLAHAVPRITLRLMTRRERNRIPAWAAALDVVQADVMQQQAVEAALDGVDTVVHLAAVNEIESQSNPDLALEVNGSGTHRLLRVCHAQGIKRFIYFSTIHVYGPGAPQPITEEVPTRPVHPYAITHRLAEDYVNWFRHSHGMETLVIRLSNGYGYPADLYVQRWTLVFNDLCMQAVRDGEIRLRSKGTQQRDFVSLTDVTRAVRHFLDLPSERWGDGLFNLGGDCSLSIYNVAQSVAAEYHRLYERKIPILVGGDDDSQTAGPVVFGIDKLKQTGFSVVGNMSEEVQRTFELCGQIIDQNNR